MCTPPLSLPGLLLVASGHAEAAHSFQAAIAAKPTLCEAYKNLGSSYGEIDGRLPEAVRAFEGALAINPQVRPRGGGRGGRHPKGAGRGGSREPCWHSRVRHAFHALQAPHASSPRPRPPPCPSLPFSRSLAAQFWPALYALLDTKQFLSDWKGRTELLATLVDHLTALHSAQALGRGPDERMHGGLAPFQTLVMPLSVETQLAITRHRARKDVERALASPPDPPLRWWRREAEESSGGRPSGGPPLASSPPPPLASSGGALRVGVISSDFGDHPVGHALLPWVRALTRRPGLELLCFASDSSERSHAGEPLRRELAASCTSFVDVTDLSDAETARTISDHRPHLLLNLVGHTAGSRHVVTQWQPAPVQAMHYGYPGTTALPAIGYMQVDSVAAPPPMHRDFTERLAYFPHSHFVAVHSVRYRHVAARTTHAHPWLPDGAAPAHAGGGRANPDRFAVDSAGDRVRRGDLGLGRFGSRDASFALCNFNQLYKMEPETFHIWANALRRVPAAFLWLTRVTVRKDTSLYAQGHLEEEASALGVHTDRLAFSFRFPSDDFVAFRALADLMVDNRAYNAHTTGADTLYAGVPSVVTAARHLAGRASASFAHAIGSANMVVFSLREYEDIIFDFGNRPKVLHASRRRLLRASSKGTSRAPFFDLDRLSIGQERLAHAMWEVHAAGRPAMHLIAAR